VSGPLFTVLLIGVVIIVGALNFFPALTLGPIVEHFLMHSGETFLDRMIGLVEGAKRQKTPNEIALTILLSVLTLIFLVVLMALKAYGIYQSVDFSTTVLVALLVCLIPTTIGGLLSAIGIAGIDRLVQKNVSRNERTGRRGRR
jgi:high-affinity K+ transport system ATPase subunit B